MLSRLSFYLRRARGLPLSVVLRKGSRILAQEAGSLLARQVARLRPTYGPGPVGSEASARLASLLRLPPLEDLKRRADWLRVVTEHTLAHRFDLLGSGWVQVRHGMPCAGVERHRFDSGPAVTPDRAGEWLAPRLNRANRRPAQAVWRLVSPDYVPIDWHLDFKSGYRWGEDRWHMDVPYGDRLGVDVKVPWELARMQHLPQLAWAHTLASRGESGFAPAERLAAEFRDQVLDFIAANPPCFGVNWRCTMDVAIRVANWLVAYDLFRASGARFDAAFEAVLLRSVHDHGRFIITHLEYTPDLRGNHYLADIVGLLFVAAYLPPGPEADAWLAFAVQELVKETRLQFHEDGANFEASTSYHRLSAEMVAFGTALVLGLPEARRAALRNYDSRSYTPGRPALGAAPLPEYPAPDGRTTPFPPEFLARLEGMGAFSLAVTRPDGTLHQVGDNDSGRFLKLDPTWARLTLGEAHARYGNLPLAPTGDPDTPCWVEQHLDHRGLVAALGALCGREDFRAVWPDSLEAAVVGVLAGAPLRAPQEDVPPPAGMDAYGDEDAWQKLEAVAAADEQRLRIPLDVELLDGLRFLAYPAFGLFILRSERLYLAFRCGPVGQRGNGGHAHNDALAVELMVDGHPMLVDPGSYLYTPVPALRNAYRSVRAHFAPRVAGREPGRLNLGLFQLGDDARAECLFAGRRGFLGRHVGYGVPVWRAVTLGPDGIEIRDVLAAGANADGSRLEPLEIPDAGAPPYSPGYGMVERPSG